MEGQARAFPGNLGEQVMAADDVFIANEPARFENEDWHRLLVHIKALGASDLHVKSGEQGRVRVQGRVAPVTRRRLELAEVGHLARLLYQGDNAELEIKGGKPLDGAYALRLNRDSGLRFRYNASACDTRGGTGIKITLRELPEEPPALDVAELGRDVVDAFVLNSEGVGFVCGATGSGKTTLLAGLNRYILEMTDSDSVIETLEHPIEFTFDRVHKSPSSMITQRAVPEHVPSFADGVRNVLRCDPDYIMVGEARDSATIEAVLLAATTGHMVFTTVHSYSVGVTFRRLASQVSQGQDAAAVIGGIIDACRVIVCQSLYPDTAGRRVAVREVLVFNEEIRTRLIKTAARSLTELPVVAQELVKQFGQTKLVHAKRLLAEGRLAQRYVDLIDLEQSRLLSSGDTNEEIDPTSMLARAVTQLRSAPSSQALSQVAETLVNKFGEQLVADANHAANAGRIDPLYAEVLQQAEYALTERQHGQD